MKRCVWWLLVVGVLTEGGYVFFKDQQLRRHAEDREAYFVSMQSVAYSAAAESENADDEREIALEQLVQMGFIDEEFLRRLNELFPKGLELRLKRPGYVLQEPEMNRVSLFSSDRLVATDKKAAHWEKSGRRATKYKD